MPDIFDPGGLTDWWDVPADYFGDGLLDYTQLGTDWLSPWTGDTGFGDLGMPGAGIGGDQWFFDTQTNQLLTLPQVQQIDPNFRFAGTDPSVIGGTSGPGSYFDPGTGQWTTIDPASATPPGTPAGASEWLTPRNIIGALTAAGGLGALGLGIGSLFGGGSGNQTTTQTSGTSRGGMSPEAQTLLGTSGLVGTGPGGAGGGAGTGLLGLSDLMMRNLGGSALQGPPASSQGLSTSGMVPALGGGISAPGGSTDFNERTGVYGSTGTAYPPGVMAPNPGVFGDFGPGGNTIDNLSPNSPYFQGNLGGRPNLNAPFTPAVRQWNEATGQYGYNPGYGPSPTGGAMAFGQGGLPYTAQQIRDLASRSTWNTQGQPPQSQPSQSISQIGPGGWGYSGMVQPAQASGGGQPGGSQQGQPGLIGQQANVLGGLQNQIPQLNPAIMQALGLQAGGMAQGYLPSLSDPQAQARIQSIYQPGFDALNYNSGLALSNAREQLQQRGFQAPDIREGPTQALTAPILAAQQLGRSQLYGQMAGAQLDLASRLPMLASQLNAQNYASQAQPFNLGMQLAGAYNQPIATQGQFPLSLLDILERGRGSTSTVNTVGPQPSLTQQLGQLAPIVGAGGSLLSSAGNMLWPQQQVGLSGVMPRFY